MGDLPTLRDQFAMNAPAPFSLHGAPFVEPQEHDFKRPDGTCDLPAYWAAMGNHHARCMAWWAYRYADAMMSERAGGRAPAPRKAADAANGG